jgi:hypothetical protein
MPWVGLEPTIPAFKPVKTAHALERPATVIISENYIESIISLHYVGEMQKLSK